MNTPYDELQLARAAATAAAGVLPSGEPLSAGTPAPGTDAVVDGFAGAVVADLEAPLSGRIAVLVGPDLVGALAASPLGGLDLAAALQPTVDNAADAIGARIGAARQVELGLVLADLGGPFTSVPLHGSAPTAALLLPDALLQAVVAQAAREEDPAELPRLVASATPRDEQPRGIELLHGVDMEVTVEIGRTRMTVRELLDLAPGAVLELDRAAGSPADLLVNGRLIARGEVVVIDEDFGLRITEIAVDAAAG
ncbi:MAG TPA: flagellar motor switch protein FliN [Nocardioides sp.]|nr:flagellar motor switch protein FliN [Nocardioides sp.]